jgi:Fur family ferric uptake transcriptional regulator/Fur family peroxide stress response transcriptional regulator
MKKEMNKPLVAQNQRLTKARKTLLNVLRNRHLTFKELQAELAKEGYYNVSTLYNNLEFFLQNKMIIELNIDGVKYYDLGTDNPYHRADSHLHLVIRNNETNEQTIHEVDYPEIYEYIKSHPVFKNYDIESIRILITATKRNQK